MINKCLHGGCLVNATMRMGRGHQFLIPKLGDVVGCSNLRCDSCGAVVISAVGVALAPGVSPADAHADLRAEHIVSARPETRLYLCSCWSREELGQTVARPEPPLDLHDAVLRWQCDGHPPLTRDGGGPELQDEIKALLDGAPPAGQVSTHELDDLRMIWAAADPPLRDAITGLLRERIAMSDGLGLARALTLVDLAVDALAPDVTRLDLASPRIAAADPTCDGWSIRDRLGAAVAVCVRAGHETMVALARKLLPGSQSLELVMLMIERDPRLVGRKYVAAAARPVAAPVSEWQRTIEHLLDGAAGEAHAGAHLKMLVEETSPDVGAARVAVTEAIDRVVEGWSDWSRIPRCQRYLHVVEIFRPRAAFSRLIDAFERGLLEPLKESALLALRGYFPAPPLHASGAYRRYLRILQRPESGPAALESLLSLVPDDIDQRAEELAIQPERLAPTVKYLLDNKHRATAREAFFRVVGGSARAALQRDQRIGLHVIVNQVEERGWALEHDNDRWHVNMDGATIMSFDRPEPETFTLRAFLYIDRQPVADKDVLRTGVIFS